MTQMLTATGMLFRDRDLFVHDGARLRRLRLSAPVQFAFAALLLALVAWSAFATARLLGDTSDGSVTFALPSAADQSDIARLTAETERRVKAIEQRQIALAAALEGQNVDPAALRRLGFYPSTDGSKGGPFEKVGNATFKALFNSWKKSCRSMRVR